MYFMSIHLINIFLSIRYNVINTDLFILFYSILSFQLAKNVGNSRFNEIMEGNLPFPSPKPTPASDM